MEILTDYKNCEAWDKFVADNTSPASFLQSWEWGEFNNKILGNQIQRWAMIDDGELKIVFMLIKKSLPADKFYWYCPRGLIWKKDYQNKRVLAYPKIIEQVNQEIKGAVFMRTCPPSQFQEHISGFLKRLGFKKPKILIHSKEPDKTLILDLTKSTEDLLKKMHPKTRYNIRLAEKKGITIRELATEKDIDIFYKLSAETAKRDKISIYSKNYYSKLINFLTANETGLKLKLYLVEYQNKPLAAALVIYFGQTATYLHGASSGEHRNLMPNYLIQWQAIKDAKNAGMKIYDFWGVSEENKTWAGITRFKRGFGGREMKFIGTWDYVLDKKWYYILRLLKIIKKIIPKK